MATLSVEFQLLGDVQARIDGSPLDIGHDRQRCVLAVLLIEAGRPVAVDQLVDRVWAETPPQRAREALYSYLSRLRKSMAAADGIRIIRQPGGYLLSAEPLAVDLHRFRDLLAKARTAVGPMAALPLYQEALDLWQGEPFANLDTPWLNGVRAALGAERLAAVLDRNELALGLGRHAALLPELTVLAEAHPLDERLAEQFLLALYRCGRPAEALKTYHRFRLRLAEELGLDPGIELRRLQKRILAADPGLSASGPAAGSGSSPALGTLGRQPVPRQLPEPPRFFTGRVRELAELDAVLADRGEVVVIGGIGGIGKTWLATRWAHDHQDRYPDGQLYVDLRGFDPSTAPLLPDRVLLGFLAALGVPSEAVPTDPEVQAGLYRSLMAGRRMLILLDNARDTEQVRPLLPGSAGCSVLVTSRHQLGGLITAHGAHPLTLGTLTEAEARTLLAGRLGAERIEPEPEPVAALLRHCAGLPLALAIVAARAAGHDHLPLAALADELRDDADRLDALNAGELNANLRAVFSASRRALTADAGRVLCQISLATGPDLGLAAAAALTGLSASRIRELLRELSHAHLVFEHTPGRFRMHDLVHLYVADQARKELTAEHRHAAVRRLVSHYLHTACVGDRLLYLIRPSIELTPEITGCAPEPLPDKAAATAWFEANHTCLLAAQDLARDHGWDTEVWQLAWASTMYRWKRGHLREYLESWQAALPAARRLGHALSLVGRLTEALEELREALRLSEELGDEFGQAHAHQLLSWTWQSQGDYRQALPHDLESLRLAEILGSPIRKAIARTGVGTCQSMLGEFESARQHCRQALAEHSLLGHREGEAETLMILGYIAAETGELDRAVEYYLSSLARYRETGDIHGEAELLTYLGDAFRSMDRPDEARKYWTHALDLMLCQHRAREAGLVRARLDTFSAVSREHDKGS